MLEFVNLSKQSQCIVWSSVCTSQNVRLNHECHLFLQFNSILLANLLKKYSYSCATCFYVWQVILENGKRTAPWKSSIERKTSSSCHRVTMLLWKILKAYMVNVKPWIKLEHLIISGELFLSNTVECWELISVLDWTYCLPMWIWHVAKVSMK